MSPESKIILYVIFVVALFLIQNLTAYAIIAVFIFLLLFMVPFKSLKRGWIPITLFLLFTFVSNAFFTHGKIMCTAGPLTITQEGLRIAAIRTLRIFFMVVGAKILTATTPLEVMVSAIGSTLKPLERIGLPVGEFFSTMALTLKCFPRLKEYLSENYRNHMEGNGNGFIKRARAVSLFLLPMFIQSMKSPEMFFEELNEKD